MPIQILELTASPKPYKRFRIKIREGDENIGVIKAYDFGLDTGMTFLDHEDIKKREAYWKRHCGNKSEKQLIENLIPSPALFSARLLWGNSTDIMENMVELQKDFNRIAKLREKKA